MYLTGKHVGWISAGSSRAGFQISLKPINILGLYLNIFHINPIVGSLDSTR